MTRRLQVSTALCVTLLALQCERAGTETDNPASPDGIELRRSTKAYQTEPSVTAEDREALRQANLSFALGLYGAVAGSASPTDNLWLCPYSITNVLAMTYAGARGTTESELGQVLGWNNVPDALHPALNLLSQRLRSSIANTAVRFELLSSVWLAQDHEVSDAYLDILSQSYDTGIYLVDYRNDVEGSRQRINQWVTEKTGGLIPELFAPGTLSPNTELSLTAAAYLSAPWRDRFDPQSTVQKEFSLADGNVVDVPMMGRNWDYPFAFDVDWRAVELPFRDASMGMVFVLPNAGEFDEFEASLDAARLEQIVTRLEAAGAPSADGESLYLQLPRLSFAASFDLAPVLKELGMQTAFDELQADLSGIDPNGNLYVDGFWQKTTVGVDEEGTTAAAGTGEVLVPASITPALFFDRPFLFFIFEHSTGSVLFLGRYVLPPGTPRAPAQPPVMTTDAQTICDVLSGCSGRTTTVEACLAALDSDDPVVLEQCADCYLAGNDLCMGLAGCSLGNVCEPATCGAYCPSHDF